MFKNIGSQKIALFAFDTSTGAPKTGDGANITPYVTKDYGTVTVLGTTTATEMDSTNAKGWYSFVLTQTETNGDALLFTAKSSTANVSLVGTLIFTTPNRFSSMVIDAAGLADANAVKLGPSGTGTAQTARDLGASVLLSAGTGAGQLDFTSGVVKANAVQLLGTAWLTPGTAGTPDVNTKLLGGTSQTGRDVGASVLLSAGSGAGQLDFTSGVVKANLAQILGTALTETVGQIAAAFKQFFNISSPTSTMNVITTVTTATTATNLTNAPSAGDFTATMKTSLNAATPASVTGAVGSVTGNVGGNVVGSVASVTARVTANTDQLASQTVSAAAGVTFPTSVASPTNITAGTITTVTNLTNSPTNGDLTATMKASVTAAVPSANANADALLDRSAGVETGVTPRQWLRLAAAALLGKASGLDTTTVTYRDTNDSKNRIVATVDASGNRSVVTLDAT